MRPVFSIVLLCTNSHVHALILQTHEQNHVKYLKKLDPDYIKYRLTSNRDKYGLWWLQCWRTTTLFDMTFFSDLFLFTHDFFHCTLIIMAINRTSCKHEAVLLRSELVLPHLCSQQQWLNVWTPDIVWKGKEEGRGEERRGG